MNTFSLNIASPDGNLYKGEAYNISVRGTEGDLAIMAGHIPFVTAVKECDCKVILADESGEVTKIGHLSGGLLTVGKEETILLSSSFEWK